MWILHLAVHNELGIVRADVPFALQIGLCFCVSPARGRKVAARLSLYGRWFDKLDDALVVGVLLGHPLRRNRSQRHVVGSNQVVMLLRHVGHPVGPRLSGSVHRAHFRRIQSHQSETRRRADDRMDVLLAVDEVSQQVRGRSGRPGNGTVYRQVLAYVLVVTHGGDAGVLLDLACIEGRLVDKRILLSKLLCGFLFLFRLGLIHGFLHRLHPAQLLGQQPLHVALGERGELCCVLMKKHENLVDSWLHLLSNVLALLDLDEHDFREYSLVHLSAHVPIVARANEVEQWLRVVRLFRGRTCGSLLSKLQLLLDRRFALCLPLVFRIDRLLLCRTFRHLGRMRTPAAQRLRKAIRDLLLLQLCLE